MFNTFKCKFNYNNRQTDFIITLQIKNQAKIILQYTKYNYALVQGDQIEKIPVTG